MTFEAVRHLYRWMKGETPRPTDDPIVRFGTVPAKEPFVPFEAHAESLLKDWEEAAMDAELDNQLTHELKGKDLGPNFRPHSSAQKARNAGPFFLYEVELGPGLSPTYTVIAASMDEAGAAALQFERKRLPETIQKFVDSVARKDTTDKTLIIAPSVRGR